MRSYTARKLLSKRSSYQLNNAQSLRFSQRLSIKHFYHMSSSLWSVNILSKCLLVDEVLGCVDYMDCGNVSNLLSPFPALYVVIIYCC